MLFVSRHEAQWPFQTISQALFIAIIFELRLDNDCPDVKQRRAWFYASCPTERKRRPSVIPLVNLFFLWSFITRRFSYLPVVLS